MFALDTATGRQLAHRADERFVMCSMFKLPLVAAILAQVDAGRLQLTDQVHYAADSLPDNSPITKAHARKGSLSLRELCEATVVLSDNGAANLLLAQLGGPSAITGFARAQGDSTTRFDRTEPTMNYASGEMDTTTPRAFVGLTQAILLGSALQADACRMLTEWMMKCQTGKNRIRAGLPHGWRAGDRTGTAGPEANDTAVIWPPSHAPVVVSALYNSDKASDNERESVLREVGVTVADWAGKG